MIRRRPTITGLLARLVGRFGVSLTGQRSAETWEPGMREWYAATWLDIRRVLGR